MILSPISRRDAQEHLTRRLGAARMDAEPDAAEQIITLCAGLPLTLSIVAARAATHASHSLASIAAELTRAGSSLDALAGADPAADARASLSLSYRVLAPQAARLLRLSALHPGAELSRDVMASLGGVSVAEATSGLDELERGCLLAQPEPGRYTSHDVVRAYAAELARADSAADSAAAHGRMLDHYRRSAYEGMLVLRANRSPISVTGTQPGVTVTEFAAPQDAFAWFAVSYPVLRAVLDLTVELNLPEYTWQLAWALDPFHDSAARWQDKILVHRAALAAAENLASPAWQAHSHRSLGQAFRLLDDHEQASAHFELAHRLYSGLGDRAEQARNLHNLVAVCQARNLPEQALAHGLQALELSSAIGDPHLQAVALNNLSWMHSNVGDQAQAIASGQRALALVEELGETNLRAHVLRTLGQCHYRAGDRDMAMAQLTAALSLFRDQRDRYEEAYTLRWLAIVQLGTGNPLPARQAWQRALPILNDLGDDLPDFESFAAEDASTRR
jgi:tetratricopeptide (TPR) repeat protein